MLMKRISARGLWLPPALTAVTGASQTSITFWADLNNVSTTLSTAAAAGTKILTVAGGLGINPNDSLYLSSGSTSETQTVKTIVGPTITVTERGSRTPTRWARSSGGAAGHLLVGGHHAVQGSGRRDGVASPGHGVQVQQFSYSTPRTPRSSRRTSRPISPTFGGWRITMTAQSTAPNPATPAASQ